jgi:hypothetical protein
MASDLLVQARGVDCQSLLLAASGSNRTASPFRDKIRGPIARFELETGLSVHSRAAATRNQD